MTDETSRVQDMIDTIERLYPELKPADDENLKSYVVKCDKWLSDRGHDKGDYSSLPSMAHMALSVYGFEATFGFDIPFVNAGVAEDEETGVIVPVVCLSAKDIEELIGRTVAGNQGLGGLSGEAVVVVRIPE